jgi:hypothetical protein
MHYWRTPFIFDGWDKPGIRKFLGPVHVSEATHQQVTMRNVERHFLNQTDIMFEAL